MPRVDQLDRVGARLAGAIAFVLIGLIVAHALVQENYACAPPLFLTGGCRPVPPWWRYPAYVGIPIVCGFLGILATGLVLRLTDRTRTRRSRIRGDHLRRASRAFWLGLAEVTAASLGWLATFAGVQSCTDECHGFLFPAVGAIFTGASGIVAVVAGIRARNRREVSDLLRLGSWAMLALAVLFVALALLIMAEELGDAPAFAALALLVLGGPGVAGILSFLAVRDVAAAVRDVVVDRPA